MMSVLSDDYQFIAKLSNLKTVFQLWKAVNFQENAVCLLSDNGLRITAEDAKCVQGSAYIPVNAFEEFKLKADAYFKINLTILVECLGMFSNQTTINGSPPALQIQYKGPTHPVTILLEEDGIITECALNSQEPDQLLDFQMTPETVLNRVVLQTELLRDVWSELDQNCPYIQLVLSPDPPYFQISTESTAGECSVELPHHSDLIETFECKEETNFFYDMPRLKQAMRALSFTSKVSMRTNAIGLLSFHYMVITEDGHTCFVEFYLPPLLDTDD